MSEITCIDCDKRFDHPDEFLFHYTRSHCNDATCPKCKKQFVDEKATRKHLRMVRCPVFRNYLKSVGCESMKDDLIKKENVCSTCGWLHVSKLVMERHQRKHKRNKPEHTCTFCGKPFHFLSHYRRHLNSIHNIKQMSLKKFQSKSTIQHTCSTCEKVFDRKSNLLVHERIHNNAQPHTCQHCGQCFTQKGNLNVHIKRNHIATNTTTYKNGNNIDGNVAISKTKNISNGNTYPGMKNLTVKMKLHGKHFDSDTSNKKPKDTSYIYIKFRKRELSLMQNLIVSEEKEGQATVFSSVLPADGVMEENEECKNKTLIIPYDNNTFQSETTSSHSTENILTSLANPNLLDLTHFPIDFASGSNTVINNEINADNDLVHDENFDDNDIFKFWSSISQTLPTNLKEKTEENVQMIASSDLKLADEKHISGATSASAIQALSTTDHTYSCRSSYDLCSATMFERVEEEVIPMDDFNKTTLLTPNNLARTADQLLLSSRDTVKLPNLARNVSFNDLFETMLPPETIPTNEKVSSATFNTDVYFSKEESNELISDITSKISTSKTYVIVNSSRTTPRNVLHTPVVPSHSGRNVLQTPIIPRRDFPVIKETCVGIPSSGLVHHDVGNPGFNTALSEIGWIPSEFQSPPKISRQLSNPSGLMTVIKNVSGGEVKDIDTPLLIIKDLGFDIVAPEL